MDFTEDYLQRLTACIKALDRNSINNAIELIRNAWQRGKQIICFGNGGSALTAEHYITDWNKNLYLASGKPFYGHCLSDNIGIFSAYANDLSYAEVFIAQLKPIMQAGDVVIGISGSGNSEDVLRAIEYANQNQGISLGICGFNGGKLKEIAQYAILAPIDDMQITEDIHLMIGHLVLQTLLTSAKGEL